MGDLLGGERVHAPTGAGVPLTLSHLLLHLAPHLVELILVAFHQLLTLTGLEAAAGITWVLSIVGLVLVIRAALIPIFVKQIKSQRRMMEVAPQLKKIQDKYKGKRDQLSREAMSRETMELYKRTGTNPLASCLPLLIQMPIFFSLFSVLNDAQRSERGVGPLDAALARQFAAAFQASGEGGLDFFRVATWPERLLANNPR